MYTIQSNVNHTPIVIANLFKGFFFSGIFNLGLFESMNERNVIFFPLRSELPVFYWRMVTIHPWLTSLFLHIP